MNEQEKPLHVQVVEALGWEFLSRSSGQYVSISDLPDYVQLKEGAPAGLIPVLQREWHGQPPGIQSTLIPVPHCDTDWAVTGPLVEKYGIGLAPTHGDAWAAWPKGDGINGASVDGPTPLDAVCNLILALRAAGKL